MELIVGILYASMGFMPYHQIKPSLDPDWKELIVFLVRYNGFLFINHGVLGIFIIYVGFREKEKWAWMFVLIQCGLLSIPLLGLYYVYGAKYGMDVITTSITHPVPTVILMALLWIIALGISYKEFFRG